MSEIPGRPPPPSHRAWLGAAIAVSALLIATTAASQLEFGPGARRALGSLSLAYENNVATWWSGILFLVAGLHALHGAIVARHAGRPVAGGWAAIGIVLVLFSADEVGSMHERLSLLATDVGVSKWLAYGVVGALAGAFVAWALVGLWRAGERGAVLGMVAAFALLASVGLQEYLENTVRWSSRAALAVRAAAEEGTEVVGALVLLWVTMRHAAGVGRSDDTERPTRFAGLRRLRTAELAALLAVSGAVAVVSAMSASRLGQPADWLATAIFACAALHAVRAPLTGRRLRSGARAGLAAALAGLGSIAAVGASPSLAIAVGGVAVNVRLALLCAVGVAVVATAPRGPQPLRVLALLGAAVATTLAGAATSQTSNAVFLATPLFALAVYDAITSGDDAAGALGRGD